MVGMLLQGERTGPQRGAQAKPLQCLREPRLSKGLALILLQCSPSVLAPHIPPTHSLPFPSPARISPGPASPIPTGPCLQPGTVPRRSWGWGVKTEQGVPGPGGSLAGAGGPRSVAVGRQGRGSQLGLRLGLASVLSLTRHSLDLRLAKDLQLGSEAREPQSPSMDGVGSFPADTERVSRGAAASHPSPAHQGRWGRGVPRCPAWEGGC